MSKEKVNRNKWLHLRLSEAELKKIQAGFSQSVKRKRSEYVRDIILGKPITIYTRNQSFDNVVAEIILLKNELKAIGNNLNQSVKKLNSYSRDAEIKSWAMLNESAKDIFFKKLEQIQLSIDKIAGLWSQE